jgi:hypothetical protein
MADLVDDSDWFRRELNGYSATDPLPEYRQAIRGSISVEPVDSRASIPGSPIRQFNDLTGLTHPELDNPPQPITRSALRGVDWVLTAARDGYTYQEGASIAQRGLGSTAYYQNVARFSPIEFQNLANRITSTALERARRIETILTFGDAVRDVWERMRAVTEDSIGSLGLSDHLESIRNAIRSANPEDWRAAMWSCRSVLEGLADRLWQDPNPTYPALQGSNGGAMEVTRGRTLNRLRAYLHCKGVGGKSGVAIEAELKLLMGSLHGLYGLDNKAHSGDPVSEHDASLAVVTTYSVLSQFALRTDLQPVTDQGVCIGGADASTG